jgi:hypothetical protein
MCPQVHYNFFVAKERCHILHFVTFQEHLSLSEMTCVVQYADKTLAIFTPVRSVHLQPIQLKFATDLDMEAWQADLTKGECHDRGVGQCYCHNFWRFSAKKCRFY